MSTDANSVRCLFIQFADTARLTMISEDLVPRPQVVSCILEQYGPLDAVVHCVGMLLPNSLNKLASGSGSEPAAGVR